METSLRLQTDSILQIPLQKYEKDFVFVVNSEKYETSSIVADLLSPIISSRHLIDPTLNEFTINTKTHGDFNLVINLIDFKTKKINEKDFQFIAEIISQLGTEKIEIINQITDIKITNENILEMIEQHQKHPKIYHKLLESEIDYFISHFSELKSQLLQRIRDNRFNLNDEIFELVISSGKLVLDSEDDLLEIINELYLKNKNFSKFFEFVEFKNIETEKMREFIQIFDINDISIQIWSSICNRLQQPILKDDQKELKKSSIENNFIEIANKPKEFDGILNYFQKNSNIKDEVNITASSIYNGNPFDVIRYDDLNNFFSTGNKPDSWICFEFKNHKIIPSNYIIRSFHDGRSFHLKSWVFEGSNDNNDWTVLDEQKDNGLLNGSNYVHSFSISIQKPFKYLRIRQTGPNWYSNYFYYLWLNAIELYGKII